MQRAAVLWFCQAIFCLQSLENKSTKPCYSADCQCGSETDFLAVSVWTITRRSIYCTKVQSNKIPHSDPVTDLFTSHKLMANVLGCCGRERTEEDCEAGQNAEKIVIYAGTVGSSTCYLAVIHYILHTLLHSVKQVTQFKSWSICWFTIPEHM